MRSVRPILLLVCAAVMLRGLAGCALVEFGQTSRTKVIRLFKIDDQAKTQRSDNFLPKIVPPMNAIAVEAYFVERPLGDPLLGDELWREVSEVSALSPERRGMLGKNGFRVGHCSATPPRALQKMLGLTTNFSDDSPDEDLKRHSFQRFHLRSGAEGTINIGDAFTSQSPIALPTKQGFLAKEFKNVQCVLKMRASRLQEGWATLSFIPEIHHGVSRYQPMAGDLSWSGSTRQTIEPLFDQRFEITLNLHEMAVITAWPESAVTMDDGTRVHSVGQTFFLGEKEDRAIQRLLIVRLTGTPQINAVYTK